MEYLKFTRTFVNGLSLLASTDLNLDNILQGNVKNFLVNEYSFATDNTELASIKTEIEESYKDLLQVALVEYTQAKAQSGVKTKSHTRDLTQEYGDEDVKNSYFEPNENGTQAETKINAQNTQWGDDTTSETIEEEESNNDNYALKDFYESVKNRVAEFFGRYLNVYLGVE